MPLDLLISTVSELRTKLSHQNLQIAPVSDNCEEWQVVEKTV